MDRAASRAAAEAHLARGHLRRALGAFRRSLELDLRGEQSFELHQLISACAQVLSARGAYFLHPSDETERNRRLESGVTAQATPDFAALSEQARQLGLDELATRLSDQRLPPGFADQPLVNTVGDFAQQARDAQLWLYEALLAREEPAPA